VTWWNSFKVNKMFKIRTFADIPFFILARYNKRPLAKHAMTTPPGTSYDKKSSGFPEDFLKRNYMNGNNDSYNLADLTVLIIREATL
jgi:hypothetical protein